MLPPVSRIFYSALDAVGALLILYITYSTLIVKRAALAILAFGVRLLLKDCIFDRAAYLFARPCREDCGSGPEGGRL